MSRTPKKDAFQVSAQQGKPDQVRHNRLADRMTIIENQLLYAELSIYAKVAYIALAMHRNSDTGTCFPSHNSLAKLCSCSVKSIRRALDELETVGYITKQARMMGKGGQSSNLYTVLGPLPATVKDTPLVCETTPPGLTDHTPWSVGPTNYRNLTRLKRTLSSTWGQKTAVIRKMDDDTLKRQFKHLDD